MINTPVRPGFVRLQSGREVPASPGFSAVKSVVRKFLVVLQYYEGDREAARDLAFLLHELEPTKNKEADLLIMRRADARPMDKPILDKLALKFGLVHQHTCRRSDSRGYPMAPNNMFSDLMMLMGHTAPFKDNYFAFINLEPDAVPTRPGWISELIQAHHSAKQLGFWATGYIHDNPVPHLNGLAVWDQAFRLKVPQVIGASPSVAYDIWHSKRILPHATQTHLIKFKYRCPTITPEELFGDETKENSPCVFHGVKDDSARKAVRARHVTFTAKSAPKATQMPIPSSNAPESQPSAPETPSLTVVPLPNVPNSVTMGGAQPDLMAMSRGPAMPAGKNERPKVYTYAHKHKGINPHEMKAVLEVWKKGWQAAGWTPIILTVREAAKHVKFDEFSAKVEKFPCSGDKFRQLHRFLRWLALDQVGGGLLVDWDVLPQEIGAATAPTDTAWGFLVDGLCVGVSFDAASAKEFVAEIFAYEPGPGVLDAEKPDVNDMGVMAHGPLPRFISAPSESVRHFSSASLGVKRKSVAMEEFLSNPVPA